MMSAGANSMGDSFIASFLSQIVSALPMVLICLIGIALMLVRPLPKKARAAGITGLMIIGVTNVASRVFFMYVTTVIGAAEGYSSNTFSMLNIVGGVVIAILNFVGIALLIAAVCIREPAATTVEQKQNPYQA
jgi:heme/copper-type cytochrome/quinol oxidase subunit 4